MAGSLRTPARCTGISALKPSRSRVPWWNATDPGGPLLVVQLMAVNGPMARSVEDLRAALAVISGCDPRDPWSVPPPADRAAHPGTGPIAVAVIAEPEGGPTHPHVAASVRRAADALAEAGYAYRRSSPSLSRNKTWPMLVMSCSASVLLVIRWPLTYIPLWGAQVDDLDAAVRVAAQLSVMP